MCSSRPKGSTDPVRPLLETPAPCPECGALALTYHTGACNLLDGTTLKRLTRLRCEECGAELFDDRAMEVIERERQERGRSSQALA